MKKIVAAFIMVVLLLVGISFTADAACTQAIPTQAKGLFLSSGMTSTHAYKIAFYQAAATWDATTTAYSATNEITGTNYAAGGYLLSGFTVTTTGTTAFITWSQNVQSNVTFNQSSTCAIIYDSTLTNAACTALNTPWFGCTGAGTGNIANAAIYVGTFTSVQPSAGTLTTTFPAFDSSNAILRIAIRVWDWFMPEAFAASRIDAWVQIHGLSMGAFAQGQ